MTPYQYVTNNPIMFTDPTGMERNGIETELYNSNGEKIGEDVNGNDGNVSIIFDDNKAKKIEKNTKKGILASQDDVDSGVKTTKAVIIETLDNLTRTEKNGGIAEETSVVDPSGNITRGVVDTKSYEVNGSEIFSTQMPYVEGNNNTGIHSHVPLNAKINDAGGIEYSSSYQPGPLV